MGWEVAEISRIGPYESQLIDLGDTVCVRHLVPAGFDSAPLYRGLPDDMCPCEHWCYLARGTLRYRFADGESLSVEAGDAFRLRAGHLADAVEDAELIEFTEKASYELKRAHQATRVIEDRVTREQIVIRQSTVETDGELLEMDDFWPGASHETPEHVHPGMEERWQVMAGTVRFTIGGIERTLGVGETIAAPPATPHRACSVGEGAVHLRIQMRPALRWQEFVERLFALGEDRGGESLGSLMREFSSEIAPAPPART